MSDSDDLELEALQRQLDDALETTRPRAGFEDELWTRIQARRPAGTRLRDAWAGLIQGIRAVPAVPTAAVAALLVVIIGVGALALSGVHLGGGTATSGTTGLQAPAAGQDRFAAPGAFGKLPSPALNNGTKQAVGGPTQPSTSLGAEYGGPVTLTWTGKLDMSIASAPVFRYQEPSITAADQFATSLGAVFRSRPAGYLGSYETTDFNVLVRGTVQSPAHEPSFTILPLAPIEPIEAAGGPANVAIVFLAQHSLAPAWPYTSDASVAGDQAKVTLLRQFAVAGYGYAYLIDGGGERYGVEVDLLGNRPTRAAGPLPLSLETASYPIISADDAVRSALASSPGAAASGTPAVALTEAELVYALVYAGDHSFYEPAILFSGKFTVDGIAYVKRVLVPAVDPSQRSS
jgi:hypothetical protein